MTRRIASLTCFAGPAGAFQPLDGDYFLEERRVRLEKLVKVAFTPRQSYSGVHNLCPVFRAPSDIPRTDLVPSLLDILPDCSS
jgi:hypothetical protein